MNADSTVFNLIKVGLPFMMVWPRSTRVFFDAAGILAGTGRETLFVSVT